MTTAPLNDLIGALVADVERLVERHLATTKTWYPHEYVPWDRAVDTDPRAQWDADASPLPSGVRAALVVNLLTEDNLPYYFESIHRLFANEVWRSWAKRWTAEEMRHSIVIRDYITVTHAVDLVALEDARMQQVSRGEVPQPDHAVDGLVYVALQELATRIAHRNTGALLDDEVGYKVMARVAADENLHYLFYRDLVSAALAVDPSTMMHAIERQVKEFEMPGTGIPNFSALASEIAATGIYDFSLHHSQVLVPVVLRHWNIEEIEGLDAEAEQSRDRTVAYINRVGSIAERMAQRRAAKLAGASA